MEFFENMEPMLKTFWIAALLSSLIFCIQSALTFTGTDAMDGISADFDGDLQGGSEPFQLFSFRNLINFLLGFSWTGISFYGLVGNTPLLILISMGAGIAFVVLFFVIIKQIQKLEENNSFQLSEAINKSAEVYLTIPERKSGKGKVLISIRGSFRELDAMTDHERLSNGTVVKVIRIESENILMVEKI